MSIAYFRRIDCILRSLAILGIRFCLLQKRRHFCVYGLDQSCRIARDVRSIEVRLHSSPLDHILGVERGGCSVGSTIPGFELCCDVVFLYADHRISRVSI